VYSIFILIIITIGISILLIKSNNNDDINIKEEIIDLKQNININEIEKEYCGNNNCIINENLITHKIGVSN